MTARTERARLVGRASDRSEDVIADSLAAIAHEIGLLAELVHAGGWDVKPLEQTTLALCLYAREIRRGQHVRVRPDRAMDQPPDGFFWS